MEDINLTKEYRVKEYTEAYDVILRFNAREVVGSDEDLNPVFGYRDVIIATNEGGYNCTIVDAHKLYDALRNYYE